MYCYLVRHGKDDDTVRGGWSDCSLTLTGVQQAEELAMVLSAKEMQIDVIHSSDLQRAKETAEILSEHLGVPILYNRAFREVNNGDLAGMKNELAKEKYPGLYWASLAYDECYPNGESSEMFFERVNNAWHDFKKAVVKPSAKEVLLVTHGGVIEAILCIENGVKYSNKVKHFSTPYATAIPVKIS